MNVSAMTATAALALFASHPVHPVHPCTPKLMRTAFYFGPATDASCGTSIDTWQPPTTKEQA
jgi:hypothetical protein